MKRSLCKTACVADVLASSLEKSVSIGIRGVLVTGLFAGGYVVIGGLLTVFNRPLAPQPFLSTQNDPYFFGSITAVSLFLVQTTGSIILYKFLTGVEDQQSQVAILMSYIGLGCGGAALRFTLPQTIGFLFGFL